MLSKSRSRSEEERSNGEQSLPLLRKRGCFLRRSMFKPRSEYTDTRIHTQKKIKRYFNDKCLLYDFKNRFIRRVQNKKVHNLIYIKLKIFFLYNEWKIERK